MESAATYRDAPARCPACAVTMKPRQLFEATIDVCGDCQGVWVDWFDGELERVVGGVGPPSHRPLASNSSLDRNCPRCQITLVIEQRGHDGTVFRCGECGGAFVPRTSFEALVSVREGQPSISDPWGSIPARLLAVLEWLLSGKE